MKFAHVLKVKVFRVWDLSLSYCLITSILHCVINYSFPIVHSCEILRTTPYTNYFLYETNFRKFHYYSTIVRFIHIFSKSFIHALVLYIWCLILIRSGFIDTVAKITFVLSLQLLFTNSPDYTMIIILTFVRCLQRDLSERKNSELNCLDPSIFLSYRLLHFLQIYLLNKIDKPYVLKNKTIYLSFWCFHN